MSSQYQLYSSYIYVPEELFNSLPLAAQEGMLTAAKVQVDSLISNTHLRVQALPKHVKIDDDLKTACESCINFIDESHVAMASFREVLTIHAQQSKALTFSVQKSAIRRVEFESIYGHGQSSYMGSSITMQFDSTIALNSAVIPLIRSAIRKTTNDAFERDTYPYQVILVSECGKNLFYNSTVGKLERDLERAVEDYTDGFNVDKVVINMTHQGPQESIASSINITAGHGEGVPSQLPGTDYWLLDLHATTVNCVLYAYHAWSAYANDYTSQSPKSSLIKYGQANNKYLKTLREEMHQNGPYSINDIQRVWPHPCRVVYNVANLSPLDTVKECLYWYQDGHVSILVHASILARIPKAMKYIERRSKTLALNKICAAKYVAEHEYTIATLDIECYKVQKGCNKLAHVPTLVGLLVSGTEYSLFKGEACIRKVFEHMLSYKWETSIVHIWIHNGGRYDVHLMFDHILDYAVNVGYEPVKLLDTNGSLISVTFTLKSGVQIVLRDSYRLLPSSLDTVAKWYGFQGKSELPTPINEVTEYQLLHEPVYHEYLHNDCMILYNSLQKYRAMCMSQGQSDPLVFCTQSSYTKHKFYQQYYKPDVYPLYTMPKWLHQWVQQAYTGGRNEMFHKGTVSGPLYMYDFTSLYPYCGTLDLPYGVPKMHELNGVTLSSVSGLNECLHWFGFVDVTIVRTPSEILPYFGKHTDKGYVFDHFENVHARMTTVELLRMLRLGYTVNVHKYLEYQKAPYMRDMFKDLAHDKQVARANGNVAAEKAAKLSSVSAYGVFGYDKYARSMLRVYDKSMQSTMVFRELSGSAVWSKHQSGKLLATERLDVKSSDTNVAVSAFIAAYGRDTLYDLLVDVKQAGGTVYYTDTDSIITNMRLEDYPTLCSKWMGSDNGTSLGGLKREYTDTTIQEAIFATLKVYGLKLATDDNVTYDIRASSVRIDPSKYEATYNGLKPSITKGFIVERMGPSLSCTHSIIVTGGHAKVTKSINLIEIQYTKRLTLNYTKGIVKLDGGVLSLKGYAYW